MINPWIQAFRLKTLPLALSNTIMGSAVAVLDGGFRWSVFVLAALTTVFLQIISNMANDYGDFVNGKDTEERIGPKRMVQSGEISAKAMLRGIIILGVLTAFTGLALILVGTAGIDITNILFCCFGNCSYCSCSEIHGGQKSLRLSRFGRHFCFCVFRTGRRHGHLLPAHTNFELGNITSCFGHWFAEYCRAEYEQHA